MKRTLALCLALLMALSLCACGGEKGIDKSDASNYIGVWSAEHMRLTVSKGGVGAYEQPGTEYQGAFDFTWEVKDDVLVILFDLAIYGQSTASFELDDEGTSLTILHNGLPDYAKGVTALEKMQ